MTTKPPIWFWTVDDKRIEFSTAELADPRAFQRRCMDVLNMMPQVPTNALWQVAVQHAMDNVAIIEAPPDASPEGQFWEMVEKFCSGRAQALTLDEITLGKPYTDGGRTYFRMVDLIAFLGRHKFVEFKGPKIAAMLKDAGAEHKFAVLKGKGTNYWSLVEFAKSSGSFDVPKEAMEGEDPF